MCGIAGAYSKNSKINTKDFDEMIDIVSYRGPDDRGTYYDSNLALGHRRLSIIDLSRDGHQPFVYSNKYVIIYNGEIYNYIELKDELKKRGYSFVTETDTEVIVAAYDCWGENCVSHFNGMWAFCIYDIYNKMLFCSRDRFGVKPFYYYKSNDLFLFASEIKQINYMKKNRAKVNKDKLMQFLLGGGQDDSEETMFQDIYQLRGGYNLKFHLESDKFLIEKYFDLTNIIKNKINYRTASKRFYEEFKKSVQLRLRADVPVGYCLSGGLDSSAIVCMADRVLQECGNLANQHAISSCFEDKRYDEQEYIDEVVNKTEVCLHKVYPSINNLFSTLDELIWHMDEPFGSTSIYAQWNVFKEAKKENLTVMLDGQGADEQLAGYSAFYSVIFSYFLRRLRFISFYKEWKSYIKLRAITEKHINSKGLLLAAIADSFAPQWLKKFGKKRLLYTKRKIPFSQDAINDFFKKYNRYPIKNPRKYILDSMQYGMSELLHYEDRNSMAHSIESRVPFLDYNLVEFLYGLPINYKIRKGITKAIMREGLRDILPSKIYSRYSKLGFVTPEDQWIKNNLKLFRDELENACDKLEPLLDKKTVMDWFDSKNGNFARGDFMTWRIICAGRWVEIFDVQIS